MKGLHRLFDALVVAMGGELVEPPKAPEDVPVREAAEAV